MLKVKIKDFKLNTDDKVGIEAALPCSLSMALAAESGCSPWQITSSTETVEFTGVVEIEPHVLSMKHICLRISGVSEPAELVLNGKTVSTPESRERIYIYNVKDRLFPGYNTIVVRFSRDRRASGLRGIRLRSGETFDPAIESMSLLAFDSAAINSVNVTQTHSDEGVTLNVNMGIIGDKEGIRAVATLVSPSGKIYYGGIADGKGSITVSDPLLWWPEGLGVANLYDLSVNLYHGDSAEDVYEVCVGLRDLQAQLDGGTVAVSIGSRPVFLRGMKLIPERHTAAFIDEKRAEKLVAYAEGVGVNAFYVPAYGRAPTDEFLDLCDKHGILVIIGIGDRDENGAPIDDAIKREIADVPRRLSYHASLAAFYVDRSETKSAAAICELLSAYCFGTPVICADGEPHTSLPASVPELRTLTSFACGEDANVLSLASERHTEPSDGFAEMMIGMAAEYRFPLGAGELSYLSELSAMDRLQSAYTEARLSGKRAFFADRLNDPEPLISPSTVDFFGRWSAAHHRLGRLYSPVTVLHRLDGYNVSFTVFNDRAKEYAGTLTYRILDSSNRELHHGTLECDRLDPCESRALGSVDLKEYVQGYERERYLAYSYSDGAQMREEVVLFTRSKHFAYKRAELRAAVSGSGKRFDVTLYPESFVGRLRLAFSTVDAIFTENYIDLTDNAPRRVSLETAEAVSAERLESELVMTSLNTVGELV